VAPADEAALVTEASGDASAARPQSAQAPRVSTPNAGADEATAASTPVEVAPTLRGGAPVSRDASSPAASTAATTSLPTTTVPAASGATSTSPRDPSDDEVDVARVAPREAPRSDAGEAPPASADSRPAGSRAPASDLGTTTRAPASAPAASEETHVSQAAPAGSDAQPSARFARSGESAPSTAAASSRATQTDAAHAPIAHAAQRADAPQQALPAGSAATTAAAETSSASAAPGGADTSWAAPTNELIETLRASVELANKEGSAQARISLEPAELGTVHIHLTQTASGLVARLSAESAIAAQAIASGQSDLRGALGSLGVSLLRLDIGSFASNGRGAQGRFGAQPRRAASIASVEETPETAPAASAGVLAASGHLRTVDVLA
jgi:flagellar hook-length control protein FliK